MTSFFSSLFLRQSSYAAVLASHEGKSTRASTISPRAIVAQSKDVSKRQNVVIVGAGIAGLATAISLQRLGVESLVLEEAETIKRGGTSLTFFKNGWSALDAMGVGTDLRTQFLKMDGLVIRSSNGRILRSFRLDDEDASQEVRAVERRILLETLASKLPQDAIRFSSKLESIETTENGDSLLKLVDGTQLLAKVVIGCDGTRSAVARWMGFSEPKYVGHCAIRGLGVFTNGQPFEPVVNQIYGRGIRVGYVPVSPTKVYWFICYNSSSPGENIKDPSVLKEQAQRLVQNWPTELRNIIDLSPDETISRALLVDRWLWPTLSPSGSRGRVVLAGDAWHPMTPNLGQGACCALEDAIVLATMLASAIQSSGPLSVEKALSSYETERWRRVFPLTIRSNVIGSLLQLENPLICSLRDTFIVPKLVRLGPMLQHTNFDLSSTLRR